MDRCAEKLPVVKTGSWFVDRIGIYICSYLFLFMADESRLRSFQILTQCNQKYRCDVECIRVWQDEVFVIWMVVDGND